MLEWKVNLGERKEKQKIAGNGRGEKQLVIRVKLGKLKEK